MYSSVRNRPSSPNPFDDNAQDSYAIGEPAQAYSSGARRSALSKGNRKKWLMGGSALFVAVVLASVLGGVLGSRSSDDDTSAAAGNARVAAGRPEGNDDAQVISEEGTVSGPVEYGYPGDLVTMEDGSTFVYNNSWGGYFVSTPFVDEARPRNDSKALNETWDYSTDFINGVNLGGWLVIEPFITVALFEQYNETVLDEYDLSIALGDSMAETIEEHYRTFITERDFAEIAAAGLNWVRLPIGFWAIETWTGEPFLEGVSWQYFVKALNWARKYGLRVEVDLHTVPGSQNGLNHSGKTGGRVGFLNGVMGVTNGQRTLNYIRSIVEFISQPQYANVAQMFMPVNEAYVTTIGTQVMRDWYLEVYDMMRNITGVGEGNGPFMTIHDGFIGQSEWHDFLQPGADRLALETHHYLAFSPDSSSQSVQSLITRPCSYWAASYNDTRSNFGFVLSGEWSLATNDCGKYLNGVNLGANYDGTYDSWGTGQTYGDCSQFTDVDTFSDEYKRQLRDLMTAYWDATRNTFFWTWRVGASSVDGKVPNPLWSYSLGLQENYIPRDPRPQSYLGACDALSQQYGLPGKVNNPWQPPLDSYMTGGAGAGEIPAIATASLNWPPASLTNIPNASRLPQLTPTGTPITLSPAEPSAGVTDTGGWLNDASTTGWLVTISGCNNYVLPYSGVGADIPGSPCTGGGQQGSIGPNPRTDAPAATAASAASSAAESFQTPPPSSASSSA